MAKTDVIPNDELSLERELIEAWRTLSDETRRAMFDVVKKVCKTQLARKRSDKRKQASELPSNVYQISKARADLRVVPDETADDTVGALEHLLAQAKQGMVLGMVFAVMYRGGKYILDATDEARRSATFARGMVAGLDDELAKLINGGE